MAYSQQLQIWCLPYFHTWCGLSANLECRSQMCCTRLSENTGCNNYAEKSPSVHHRTTLPGSIFATKALLSIGRKLVKQQYLLHMSSQYDELRPINIWNRLASLVHGTPIYFNGFVTLGFVTAPTSLSRAQPNFAQCLAVSWGGTLYIYIYIFGGCCPIKEFCQVQNSLCVQVLRSPILAALLHGTWAVGVSQTLQRGTRNGIMELSLLIIFNRECHLCSEGGHCVGNRPTF